ncbi:MAG: serpin family protein [Deltaproteobacteria bacterium]|nr:serpin family protein [Deltaproteobacteria bacterium]
MTATILMAGFLSFLAAPSATTPLAKGMNDFACDFYRQVLPEKAENTFFSPYSLQSALGMTYGGARGKTAAQMKTALKFALEGKALHSAMGKLMQDLNAAGDKGGFKLSVANGLWSRLGGKLLPSFLDLNKRHYRAGLRLLDFVGDPEGSRKIINAWVEDKTEKLIKDLLPKGIIDSSTSLVLTNAIYFKGQWAARFKENQTRPGKFKLLKGTEVEVPMMHQTAKFSYAEGPSFKVLSMPYTGDRLSMVVFLPQKKDGLPALEKQLSAAWFDEQLGRMSRRKVFVALPRFKMTQAYKLGAVLPVMGMPLAFSAKADFSGMNGARDLFIQQVLHKAFVEVNEEGTEAAAATAVIMTRGNGGGRRTLFQADHPFLFIIRDNVSGTILFMGRVMDPS